MDSDDIYQEYSDLHEPYCENTSRMYWHGSLDKTLRTIKASCIHGETVPLAWLTNSFDYAIRFASLEGYVYRIRQVYRINIWNPSTENDWNTLIYKYPEFNMENARKFIISYNWFKPDINIGIRQINRNDLLIAIKSLGYNGVFNKDDYDGAPALGIFDKFTNFFGAFDAYAWDKATQLWRSVGYPNRGYNPKTKKMVVVERFLEESNSTGVENECQNLLERPI